MKYRLWDIDINRLFGAFDNEDEALVLVRVLITSYGDAYADDLALGCESLDGSFTPPLTGGALVDRARGASPERESVSPRSGEAKDQPFRDDRGNRRHRLPLKRSRVV